MALAHLCNLMVQTWSMARRRNHNSQYVYLYIFAKSLSFLLFAQNANADTTAFFKISTLRFETEELIRSEKGVVNLNALGEEEMFHVQGEILFFPGIFIKPQFFSDQEFSALIEREKPLTTEMSFGVVPQTIPQSSHSFGTFILKMLSDRPREISIQLPRFYHPVDVFIASAQESRRIIRFEHIDTDPAMNRNSSQVALPPSRLEVPGTFYLIAHASSPIVNEKNTLSFSTVFVGSTEYVNSSTFLTLYLVKCISGAFFIMFIFYLFIFLFRRRDTSSGYLCLYALASFGLSVIYAFGTNQTPNELLRIFTAINLASIVALQFYLLVKISFAFSAKTNRFLQIISVLIGVGATLSRVMEWSTLSQVFLTLSFLSSNILICTTLYLGFKHKIPGVGFFFVGAALNCAFQFTPLIRRLLGTSGENGYFILLANFFMALALALVNAKEFALTYKRSVRQSRELEEFNANLEKLVESKTNEIRSLLDHIPQGVLSIVDGGFVAKDYSAHLEDILNTKDIAGQKFQKLLLDRSDMGADERDQVWQSILMMLGEQEINFEINSGILPSEIRLVSHDTSKYLKSTWNIATEAGIIRRILVTLLDVTHEKQLELASKVQQDEIIMIQELISLESSKTAQFFSTAKPLLLESQQLIAKAKSSLTTDAIRMLFVNVHTVKGAARTLHLKKLASDLHSTEQILSDILKSHSPILVESIDIAICCSIKTLDEYLKINQHTLNRGEDYNKIVIERDFIERHYKLLKNIIKDQTVTVDKVIQILRAQSELFTTMIFDSLPEAIQEYQDIALKIAKDLGKAAPTFQLEIEEIPLTPQCKILLDQCMIHILRNALDHGIESPKERLRAGKPEAGLLSIRAGASSEGVELVISDDGRGLAIHLLKAKALEAKLISPESSWQAIANTVFLAGVSTAASVSDISGRGVGMNAVRTFLEQEGGWIRIELLKVPNDDTAFIPFKTIIGLKLEDSFSDMTERAS